MADDQRERFGWSGYRELGDVMAKKIAIKASGKKAAQPAAKKSRHASTAARRSAKVTEAAQANGKKVSRKRAVSKAATPNKSGNVVAKVKKPKAAAPQPASSATPTDSSAPPVRPAPMPVATAAAISPPPINPQRTGLMEQQHELQPGQRVRHRYEHWWGTIVQKVAPAAVVTTSALRTRYVVSIDGGKSRDDIRGEDLTLT